MRVLVTGGAGFIGTTVCRRLLSLKNVELLNVDCLTYAANLQMVKEFGKSERYSFKNVDIRDSAGVVELIKSFKPDAIIHLAAESHVDRSIESSSDFISTNIVGTQVLLDSSLGFWEKLDTRKKDKFRFLHVSTDEVYGSLGQDGQFTETNPYNPNSPYAASKAASNHLVRAWNRTYGLPVLITNCSNNYGPYQFPEKLIPLMIRNALEGQQLPVYGDGKNIRDWLYVKDHAEALLKVLLKGRAGETYNIGGRSERRNIDLVKFICECLDELIPKSLNWPHSQLITFVKDRPGHDFRYSIDDTKIRSELGWQPKYGFEEGLKQTVLWYVDNKNWMKGVMNNSGHNLRRGLRD